MHPTPLVYRLAGLVLSGSLAMLARLPYVVLPLQFLLLVPGQIMLREILVRNPWALLML